MAEITRTLNLLICDRCAANGKETKAITQASIQVGDQQVNVDLCGMHERSLLDVWFSQPKGRKSMPERVLDNPVRCPACGYEAKNLYAMGQHTSAQHKTISARAAELNARLRDLRNQKDTPERNIEMDRLFAELDTLWAEERIRVQVRSRERDQAAVDA